MDKIHRIAAERYAESDPLNGQDKFAQINNELIRLPAHLDRLITDEYKRTLLLLQEQISSLQNQINPITYYIEADEALLNLSIPHFILQPLIENAIVMALKT